MPGETGVTVVTTLACLFYFACEAAGASSTRHSLRPLLGGLKEISSHTSGAARGENADACPRHCEERSDEAIHSSLWRDGLLRGACHRARIRATRWLAMTVVL